jgi:hypothetical protein
MAIKNRTEIKSAATTALQPTLTLNTHRTFINDDFADNALFKKDIATTVTATSTSTSLDFATDDRKDFNDGGFDSALTITNFNDGEVKYIHVTKTAGKTLSFTGGWTFLSTNKKITQSTNFIIELINKNSKLIAVPHVINEYTTTQITQAGIDMTSAGTDSFSIAPSSATAIASVDGKIFNNAGTSSYPVNHYNSGVYWQINYTTNRLELVRTATASTFFNTATFNSATLVFTYTYKS